MNEERRKKEELIERIIKEKGEEAFPKLIELLEDEDPEVKEIVAEVFYRFGDRAREFLFNEIQKRREKGFEKNDITNLYIVDILGDLGEKRMKNILYELMEKYDSEEALLVIYEALAKIGEGEVFLPELEYLMFEDSYRKELCEQVAMVLAHIPNERSLKILLRSLKSNEFSEDQKEFFRKAVEMILYKKPELASLIDENERRELGL
ncbi:HEAT repeat domain-containing protein [Thermotoga neapolitana]|nr:hypothetical protein [Thermotoga neapolitana]KFZ21817.1 hypothetical protein LA10_04223 [Thermotoga neapolitana LA10]HBF10424.1 hypothetical protein [Thermotoga neapolitana]